MEFLLLFFYPFAEVFRFLISSQVSVRVIDVLVIIYILNYLTQKGFVLKKELLGIYFLAISFIVSFLFNLNHSSLPGFFYLLRTIIYLYFFLLLHFDKTKKKWLNLVLIFFIITGFLQYFLYPDLRNLMYLGYDPHLSRLFGLFLDPNVMGLIFCWSFLWFWFSDKSISDFWTKIISFSSFLALILTFSRISYLVFIVSLVYLGLLTKKIRPLYLFLPLLIIMLVFIPKRFGEGNNLLRINSVVAKEKSWQKSLLLFKKNPLLGIGFNNLNQYHLDSQNQFPDNAKFGLDNSFLTILATSGLLGIMSYLFFFWQLFKKAKKPLLQTLVLGFFLHSLSVNSFLNPTTFLGFCIFYRFMELTEHKSL